MQFTHDLAFFDIQDNFEKIDCDAIFDIMSLTSSSIVNTWKLNIETKVGNEKNRLKFHFR